MFEHSGDGLNRRRVKPFLVGGSLVVVVPKDWAAGMEIVPGELLDMTYNGEIRIRKIAPKESGP